MSTGEAFKGIPQQVAVNRTLHSLASIVESESGELSVIVQPLDGLKLIRGEYLPVGNRLQFPTKWGCLLYTSPSPRDRTRSRMPSSA